MAYYERLSALDASFIGLEESNLHMHVGAVMIFSAETLRTPAGGLDIDRIRRAVLARLHLVPRFRQRLAHVPYEHNLIWIDDDRFRLAYHVRHAALPSPGDERALKRQVGRIMSQQLDRGRPLWEMWFVEGLEGNRCAMISKTHHCMIDGISGADLMTVILQPAPNATPDEPVPWIPRACPDDGHLMLDAARRRLGQPGELLHAASRAVRNPDAALRSAREAIAAVGNAVAPALNPASQTPLNFDVGPHRRFDWMTMDLAELKKVKNALGGTINDVVLATVSGALRHYFAKRRVNADYLQVRALVPVSVRSADERGRLGNRVAEMIAPLPVDVADPIERLTAVRETMSGLKESKQALGAEVLTAIAEWTVPNLLVQAVRLAQRNRPYNLVVTNVPGPQIPLYFLEAEMQTTYPVVPLFRNLGLVVGLFSYNGGLFWGFNADWEYVPDLHEFVAAIEDSFAELKRRADRAAARAARKKPGKARRKSA